MSKDEYDPFSALDVVEPEIEVEPKKDLESIKEKVVKKKPRETRAKQESGAKHQRGTRKTPTKQEPRKQLLKGITKYGKTHGKDQIVNKIISILRDNKDAIPIDYLRGKLIDLEIIERAFKP